MANRILTNHIKSLVQKFNSIDDSRRSALSQLAQKLKGILEVRGRASVLIVCTHNSRRSQLAEAWLTAACQYFGLDQLSIYSGGTEATAFNMRMVVAMRHIGFHLQTEQPADNPRYLLTCLSTTASPHFMFSKTIDDSYNPQSNFVAIMVCSDADEKCPIVKGAELRYSLPYDDPKESDDTPMEHQTYIDKVDEIGTEMLYLISQVTA